MGIKDFLQLKLNHFSQMTLMKYFYIRYYQIALSDNILSVNT